MSEEKKESDLKFDGLTRDQLKKIEKSMKKPQFMGLLNEYMIEISDPKNKNEYDEYLRQMEREKELPKNMKLVELKPKFCFRTFIVSQKNKKHEMKFFINMCETQYLEKPSCQAVGGSDGKPGYSWKIPNSSGKIRYDQDKKGNPCQVLDVAFHLDTFYFAARKEFQEMMINIALEAAEKQLGERKETLSRDYVILKNVICKGQDGKPALMPIRYIDGKMYNKGDGPSSEIQRDNEGRQTKLQKEINKQKDQFSKDKRDKQGDKKSAQEEKQQEQVQQNKLIIDLSEGIQRPKYSSIFTYPIDYSEFMQNPNPSMNTRRKVPSAFNVQFSIPRVQSISEVADQKLEINEQKIILKIGEKYFIDLQFEQFKIKYQLQPTLAKAKYDKKKKTLRIVIPIDQSINYHPQEPAPSLVSEQNEEDKAKIVQSEVWKNKVLDFTEPDVSVKMLETQQQQQPQKPKLIQQIDEEDQITQKPSPQQISKQDYEEEQTEQTTKKVEKFSISNYTKKAKDVEQKGIKYVFQETNDKIVLVFQMKSYKKQDVFILIHKNKEILLDWKENPQKHSFAHYTIKQEFVEKIAKIEIVFRVGFAAVTIFKTEKGKYWEKTALEQISYNSDEIKSRYQEFRSHFQRIQAEQRQQLLIKNQRQQQKKVTKALEARKIAEEKAPSTKASPTPGQPEKIDTSMSLQQEKANIFRNLQVQFINFDVPFIDILD